MGKAINNFINLDTLKAESRKVKFLGKEFEVGYIPSGLAIPLVENHNENIKTQKETDPPEKIMKDEIKSISIFCSFYEPEFTEKYLQENATAAQIDAFYKILVFAIFENFVKKLPEEEQEKASEINEKKTIGEQ